MKTFPITIDTLIDKILKFFRLWTPIILSKVDPFSIRDLEFLMSVRFFFFFSQNLTTLY